MKNPVLLITFLAFSKDHLERVLEQRREVKEHTDAGLIMKAKQLI